MHAFLNCGKFIQSPKHQTGRYHSPLCDPTPPSPANTENCDDITGTREYRQPTTGQRKQFHPKFRRGDTQNYICKY